MHRPRDVAAGRGIQGRRQQRRVLKFPTRVTWSNITLKKGIGAGTALWDWHYGFGRARQASRRRHRAAQRPAGAEQHLVFPPRPAGEIHRAGAQRDAEQRGDRSHRNRPRGLSPGSASAACGEHWSCSRDWRLRMEVQIQTLKSTVRAVDGDCCYRRRRWKDRPRRACRR